MFKDFYGNIDYECTGNWENAPLANDAPLATWVAALAEPSRDTVLRIGGGPTEHVIFAHGNYSYSKQVNGRSGYCNATTHAYGNEYSTGKPDGWPYTLGGERADEALRRWSAFGTPFLFLLWLLLFNSIFWMLTVLTWTVSVQGEHSARPPAPVRSVYSLTRCSCSCAAGEHQRA